MSTSPPHSTRLGIAWWTVTRLRKNTQTNHPIKKSPWNKQKTQTTHCGGKWEADGTISIKTGSKTTLVLVTENTERCLTNSHCPDFPLPWWMLQLLCVCLCNHCILKKAVWKHRASMQDIALSKESRKNCVQWVLGNHQPVSLPCHEILFQFTESQFLPLQSR